MKSALQIVMRDQERPTFDMSGVEPAKITEQYKQLCGEIEKSLKKNKFITVNGITINPQNIQYIAIVQFPEEEVKQAEEINVQDI